MFSGQDNVTTLFFAHVKVKAPLYFVQTGLKLRHDRGKQSQARDTVMVTRIFLSSLRRVLI